MQKIHYLFFTLCCSLCATLYTAAQNMPPQISITAVNADTVQSRLTVSYLLNDPEGDWSNVSLLLSDNNGTQYSVAIDIANLSGNFGYPIANGSHQLEFFYASSLSNSAINQWRIKLVADDFQPVDIQSIVDEVSPANLSSSMEQIEGIRHAIAGATHLQAVKDTIQQRFDHAGLLTSNQAFVVGTLTGNNVVGTHLGQATNSDVYIVDAHFDSVNIAPGADDNGSGVVGMLEAMRVLSQYNFRSTVRFIGFDFEESGLLGSANYVNGGGLQPSENVKGVFNYEMIGYYSDEPNSQEVPVGFNILYPALYNDLVADQFRGNFITNVANVASDPLRRAYDSLAAVYVPQLKVRSLALPGNGQIAPDFRRSDHAIFWDAGYQALMLTDGANFRNQNYHTANDVSSILDYDFMANTVRATVASVAHLAGIQHTTQDVAALSSITSLDSPLANAAPLLRLQPNPAHDQTLLTIYGCPPTENELHIALYNAQASLLQQYTLYNTNRQMIDTRNLAAGTYWVRTSGKQWAQSTTFVKQ